MAELLHDRLRDLFWRRPRIFAPIVRIDLVADGDVAHVLGDLKRTHFVGSVGLLIDRIRRAERSGLMPSFPAKSRSVRLSSNLM